MVEAAGGVEAALAALRSDPNSVEVQTKGCEATKCPLA